MNSALAKPAETGKADEPWKEELERFLSDAKRVLVLGIGNEIRADDGVGTHVAKSLRRACVRNPLKMPCLAVPGGAAPENFIGPALEFGPSHIVIVDAMARGARPGSISTIDPARLGGVSLSSHSMPRGVLRDYLLNSGHRRLLVLGVQPSTIGLGMGMSREVKSSARRIVRALLKALARGAESVRRPIPPSARRTHFR